MKRGVLLMAYGAPDSLDDVEAFYTDIRRGRKPPPDLLEQLLDRYRRIGGGSPLLKITRRQATALECLLGNDYTVYLGMRHWSPRIADTVARMVEDGIREVVAIVMAPHFSSMSIGAYMRLLDQAVADQNVDLVVHRITDWHLNPRFTQMLEARVRETMARFTDAEQASLKVAFTAHSLPKSILESGDPYPDQLQETGAAIADGLGLSNWQIAYQSAGRTPEPWLGPDLLELMRAMHGRGERALLVCVIGFVADHLEVLYDVDIEAMELARELGMHLERIRMPNDDHALVTCLAELTRSALA